MEFIQFTSTETVECVLAITDCTSSSHHAAATTVHHFLLYSTLVVTQRPGLKTCIHHTVPMPEHVLAYSDKYSLIFSQILVAEKYLKCDRTTDVLYYVFKSSYADNGKIHYTYTMNINAVYYVGNDVL